MRHCTHWQPRFAVPTGLLYHLLKLALANTLESYFQVLPWGLHFKSYVTQRLHVMNSPDEEAREPLAVGDDLLDQVPGRLRLQPYSYIF